LRDNDWIPGTVWLVLGLAVLWGSVRLKLGSLVNPGPGLMPFILGAGLTICSLFILIQTPLLKLRKKKGPRQSIWTDVDFKKIILVVGCLLGYTFMLEKVGFALTTFLILTILFKAVGSQKWPRVLIASISTVVISYLVFIVILKVELPAGFLGRF
jgi:putative tricarboxylic transport membrane protein